MRTRSHRAAIATILLAAISLCSCGKNEAGKQASSPDRIRIGFIVKQPEEPWFQIEWKFADEAAAKLGFEVIKIGATDGEKVLAAIDNLTAVGAKGFVICTPDVKLGPAIAARAKKNNLKLMSVDDQFVGPDGKFMDVHHLGISACNIGKSVGAALFQEFKKRGWKAGETAVCAVTFEELNTAKERTDGAIAALAAAGFPKSRIFKAPQKTSDVPGAFDAVNVLLTQHPDVRHWLACGMNDSAVMGAIRAMEGRKFDAAGVAGIGINGTDCLVEFEKPKPTGFYASILLSARQHGYDTAQMMFKWIKDGTEPPKDTRTTGILIHRGNYKQVMKEQGLIK